MRFGENSAPVKKTLGEGREGKWVVFIGGNSFGFLGWLSSLHFGQASWVLEWDKKNAKYISF